MFGPPGDAVGDAGEEVLEFGYCFDVCLPFLCSMRLCGCVTVLMCVRQVAIRAFLPIWTFLYLLQFLLLPLIARDYWVSNLFGNTMYLLALSYYFVITFLGYNGTFTSRTLSMEDISSCEADNVVHSFALPEPNRGSIGAHTCAGDPVDHQPLHVRLRDESRAGVVVWCQFAETCVTAPSFMYSW